ncbi:unnamed protein product [Penicillium camemberti]|uniref:Str. FM013 n=1 Tax=Penicillium camemberti (strain FM 013) TaxID=1429867 RepID=A0A0G4PWM2_PENC3|nr:unnamed protein product [Penicillium camemberti]
MEDIVQSVRQIGQQQAQNAYYRDCYALFKLLQDLTEHTSNELQRLHKTGTERSNNAVHQVLQNFQDTICTLVERLAKPKRNVKSFAQ